jgi:hypothetical protein
MERARASAWGLVVCLLEDGAGATVLVRFTGNHLADPEVIV